MSLDWSQKALTKYVARCPVAILLSLPFSINVDHFKVSRSIAKMSQLWVFGDSAVGKAWMAQTAVTVPNWKTRWWSLGLGWASASSQIWIKHLHRGLRHQLYDVIRGLIDIDVSIISEAAIYQPDRVYLVSPATPSGTTRASPRSGRTSPTWSAAARIPLIFSKLI